MRLTVRPASSRALTARTASLPLLERVTTSPAVPVSWDLPVTVLTSVSLPAKAPSAAMGMQSKPRMAGKLVTDSEYRSGKPEAEASAPSHRTALA